MLLQEGHSETALSLSKKRKKSFLSAVPNNQKRKRTRISSSLLADDYDFLSATEDVSDYFSDCDYNDWNEEQADHLHKFVERPEFALPSSSSSRRIRSFGEEEEDSAVIPSSSSSEYSPSVSDTDESPPDPKFSKFLLQQHALSSPHHKTPMSNDKNSFEDQPTGSYEHYEVSLSHAWPVHTIQIGKLPAFRGRARVGRGGRLIFDRRPYLATNDVVNAFECDADSPVRTDSLAALYKSGFHPILCGTTNAGVLLQSFQQFHPKQ